MSTLEERPNVTPADAHSEAIAAEPAAGDPAVLGLPAFVIGSLALGLALIG